MSREKLSRLTVLLVCVGLGISNYPVLVALVFEARGNAYYSKGQHDRATQDYDQAVKLDPNKAEALAAGGLAYAHKKPSCPPLYGHSDKEGGINLASYAGIKPFAGSES